MTMLCCGSGENRRSITWTLILSFGRVINYRHLKSAVSSKLSVSTEENIICKSKKNKKSNPTTSRGSRVHEGPGPPRPPLSPHILLKVCICSFPSNLMRTAVMIAALNVNEWGKPCSLVSRAEGAPSGCGAATWLGAVTHFQLAGINERWPFCWRAPCGSRRAGSAAAAAR